MELAMKLDDVMEIVPETIKAEVEKIDDFEKMILDAASSAAKKISSKKDAEVVGGMDVSAVATAITDKKKLKEKIKVADAEKIVPKKKREKKPESEKGLPIGNRDSKYGEPVFREMQPTFDKGCVVKDGKHICSTNMMSSIKTYIKDAAKEFGVKKVSVHINGPRFFTQYHMIPLEGPIAVDSVGKTFLTISFDGKPWLIHPERQDSEFSISVSPVAE